MHVLPEISSRHFSTARPALSSLNDQDAFPLLQNHQDDGLPPDALLHSLQEDPQIIPMASALALVRAGLCCVLVHADLQWDE